MVGHYVKYVIVLKVVVNSPISKPKFMENITQEKFEEEQVWGWGLGNNINFYPNIPVN